MEQLVGMAVLTKYCENMSLAQVISQHFISPRLGHFADIKIPHLI